MTRDTLLQNALHDLAGQAQVPPGLADRALGTRNRRRSHRVALAAGTSALLVGAVIAGVSVNGPAPAPSPGVVEPVPLSSDTSVQADPGNPLPRRLLAAGDTAVGAFYTIRQLPSSSEPQTVEYTWHLYNSATRTYEKTRWAFLDVAPGLHRAAVLEGPLPTSRVGILDLETQQVTRWIAVDHPVGGVAWAPDGRRLILTTYDENPDAVSNVDGGTRTGFYLTDGSAASPGEFHALPRDADNGNSRQDLKWSRTGKLIWAPTASSPMRRFYGLDGSPQPAPAHEGESDQEADLSPNGTLMPVFGPSPGPAVTVKNVKTSTTVAVLPIEQALAWAGDDQLFAIGCEPGKCTGTGEFRNRLLLVDLAGKITPLTGYQRSDQDGAWKPVFTHR